MNELFELFGIKPDDPRYRGDGMYVLPSLPTDKSEEIRGPAKPGDEGKMMTLEYLTDPMARARRMFDMMDKKEQETFLSRLLKNLELTGQYNEFANDFVSGSNFGGRVGYNLPLDKASTIRAGVSGGGYKIDTPVGQFKDKEISGGDIGYRFGPNDLSLSYTKRGVLPELSDENSPMNIKDFWRLLYRRQF